MYYAKYLGHRSNVGRFFTNLVWGSLCSLMLTRACRLSKLCHKELGGGSWGVPRGSPVPGHCAQRPLRAAALARRFARGCAEPQAEGGSSCFPRTEQPAQLPQMRVQGRSGLLSSRVDERLFLFNLSFTVAGQDVN